MRSEFLLFLAAFVTFSWFHQGGGWNQNSRFAQVRAIAEDGTFAIDDYLVYRETGGHRLHRVPVRDGEVVLNGMPLRLCWTDSEWRLSPVNGVVGGDARLVPLEEVAASGDVSYKDGHFFPNKPPGAVLAAVPAYWLILHAERALGFDPDDWRVLNANLWLTTALSGGLFAALGVIVFHRAARILSARNAFAATVAFGFGTMYLPFATVLFDHDLVAASLLLSFYLILESHGRPALREAFLSGLAAGFAAITNYLAAVAVVFLGIYLLAKRYRSREELTRDLSWLGFGAGVLAMLLAICLYNERCFGAPTAISNSFQNPAFEAGTPRFLGMFGFPNPLVAALLLVSPFRGIFYTSPVLIAGVCGWFAMRRRGFALEARLFAALALFFFLMNVTFNGWHGGFATVPRYLIPAVPFLALPLVFVRWRIVVPTLCAVSFAMQFLIAAVEVQAPPGIGSLAMIEGRAQWFYDPMGEYIWPLFATGRARPILEALEEEHLAKERSRIGAEAIARRRAALNRAIRDGKASPLLLAGVRGPVSANVVGPWDGEFFHLFAPGSASARWASFNAGELAFPGSRWSLLPVILIAGGLLGWAWRTELGNGPG